MSTPTNISTYCFIGTLSARSAKYNVQEFPLLDGWKLEVFLNGIAIWGHTNNKFDEMYPMIREVFSIIVAAFVFKTKKRLSFSLQNWVETKHVSARENVVGWILDPFANRKHYSERSPRNNVWKKSAWLYNNRASGSNNHILALKDYYSAIMDSGDDAFLFAYRAVEDICRAITGCDEIRNQHWKAMHARLGTSETLVQPLTKVAKEVRHGNLTHQDVLQARPMKDTLLDIAHEVIEREFKIVFGSFAT